MVLGGEKKRLDAKDVSVVGDLHADTRIRRDDSAQREGELRQSVTRCEQATAAYSEVQGYARSPLLFYSRLSSAAKKEDRRQMSERERVARTCSAGKATLFSFLS